MRSFKTFEEALNAWNSIVPQKSCDFVLRIWSPGWKEDGKEAGLCVPITDWTMPDVGIKFDNIQGLCHLQPTVVSPGTMEIKFVSLLGDDDYAKSLSRVEPTRKINRSVDHKMWATYDEQGPKSLHALWSTQFNKEGRLVFIPIKQRPHIALYRITATSEVQVLHLTGCAFTYPAPTNMSQASTEVCQYSMQVSYCDIMQY